MNRFNLSNKVAIITGGNGFLGVRHAEALAEVGCNLVLFDKFISKSISKKIESRYSVKCLSIKGDVTKEISVKETLKIIKKKFGKIDILINNAAINPIIDKKKNSKKFSKLENFSINTWNNEMAVGLTGAFLCSKIFGSEMSKKNGGVIINISSDLGIIAPDQRIYNKNKNQINSVKPVTYSVIKHGIIGLSKYLATYWPHRNIRSNTLCIGGVKNDQPREFVKKISELIPMNRMAEPDEYKSAIQFLCSDASKYMNGSTLVIDGGRTCW